MIVDAVFSFRVLLAGFLLGLCGGASSDAAIALTLGSLQYAQNFDGYVGTPGSVPNGWTVTGGQTYRGIDNGANPMPGYYALGESGDHSLGVLTDGSGSNFSIQFSNASGQTITQLLIDFTYQQWTYQNDSGFDLAGTGDLATNFFIDFSDFSGSTLGTNQVVTEVPNFLNLQGLSIPDGAIFGLQFQATDALGVGNSVSIDDFSLTAVTAIPEPGFWCLNAVLLLASQVRKWSRRR